jgi:membrane fusion protein (multidrug efflux system)
MKRKIAVAIVLLVLVAGGLAGVKAMQIKSMIEAGEQFTLPPEAVSSAEVREETWETSLASVGTVTPVRGVVLRSEMPGTVTSIHFESGASAERGQVLVRLDTSAEAAQLRSAEAQAELARLNVERARGLRAENLISQAELDTNEATWRQTASQADNIRAAIDKKVIRAPFSGRLGIREVNVGQYLNSGDPIVSLQSQDPIYVDFSMPEQSLSQLRRGMPVRVTTDAVPGRTFEGSLTALDAEIDRATRNIKLQATLPNSDGALRSGMFARVDLVLPQRSANLVIPATAVLHAPYGDSVFVISDGKDEKTGQPVKQVRLTTVRLGATRGDFVAVTRGLEKGQQVATSGVFKLRNGTAVVVDNSLAPDAQAAPEPEDS